ncbi:MAG TPA: hypothetical protein O0X70_01545 [Methanocorpusculum sp.]|nr:hypothetical protein [Methanocorpusculum sp.]
MEKPPVLLLISALLYTGACIMSLAAGIIMWTGCAASDPGLLGPFADMYTKYMHSGAFGITDAAQLALIAGVFTTFVGVFQGAVALGLLKGWKAFWYLALAFTLFSLISAASKLIFLDITLFTAVKVIAYLFILYTLMRKDVRNRALS